MQFFCFKPHHQSFCRDILKTTYKTHSQNEDLFDFGQAPTKHVNRAFQLNYETLQSFVQAQLKGTTTQVVGMDGTLEGTGGTLEGTTAQLVGTGGMLEGTTAQLVGMGETPVGTTAQLVATTTLLVG